MSFGFGFGFTKITAAIRAAFSPSSLFATNEPGVWYDPSDLSTLYQDSVGTTPVTAVEQPVGLMLDKSKGLVLGSELNTQTVNTVSGTWTQSDGVVTADGLADLSSVSFNLSSATVVGRYYEIVLPSNITGGSFYVDLGPGTGASQIGNLSTQGKVVLLANNATSLVRVGRWSGNAAGNIGPISVRELPGNHATQTTATSRPVLSARYNLLTKTEQFDDAAWVKTQSVIVANQETAPDGTLTADKFIPNSGIGAATAAQIVSVSVAAYTFQFRAKAAEQSVISLVSNLTGIFRANIFNLSAQTVSAGTGWTASIAPDPAGGGWFICTCSATADTAASKSFQISNNSAGWAGDGTSGIYIWGADLRVANSGINLPPYQRVNTATDYDTVGFPHYLRFDGVDDWLVTNTITPGIDKVQVFAGVRKLSDATTSTLAELSLSADANNGAFFLRAPTAAQTNYQFVSKGTFLTSTTPTQYAAPRTDVLTCLSDIAGDRNTFRINGAQVSQSAADQGTGNYLAYPLYIGRRAGTSLPFNGHLYSLIVRFGNNLPIETIEKTEKYINTKTRAY